MLLKNWEMHCQGAKIYQKKIVIKYWRVMVDKIIEAKRILDELKMPKAQQSDVCDILYCVLQV